MTAPQPARDGEVCQALTGCVNALGQHSRRCPAAPSEPPAADSPTPGTEVCPGDFQGDSMVIPCGHPKGHPPLRDGSDRYWRHGQGSMHWGRMSDYSSAAPPPVDTTEPPADAHQYRHGGHQPWCGPECTAMHYPPVPAETQQDDERERIAEEVASRYFERGDDELGQLRTDVYAALTGDFARPSADTETLREQVETWIDEAPEQTAGLDLLRQIIGRPR